MDDFDGDAGTCVSCLTRPAKHAPRSAGAAKVTTRRVAPAVGAAPAPTGDADGRRRTVPVGVVGRGDREVRARRARTTALERLVEMHEEDFERLLAETRRAEGV